MNRVKRVQYSMGPQLLTIDQDDLLRTLADKTCRKTITRFETLGDSAMSLDELATETRMDTVTDTVLSATVLHHAVLPKLAAADILQYNSSSRTVHYEGQERVKAALATIESSSR